MVWTYKLLPQIPRPPKAIIEQIDQVNIPSEQNMGYTGLRMLEDWRGCNGPARRNMCRVPPMEYDRWVRDTISGACINTTVMYCNGSSHITSTGAHTDKVRHFVMIYNLLSGGPESQLCFWQEKNHPILREDGLARGRYHDLELIDSVDSPIDVWYIVNGQVLHSVENLTGPRINLQISFVDLPNDIASMI